MCQEEDPSLLHESALFLRRSVIPFRFQVLFPFLVLNPESPKTRKVELPIFSRRPLLITFTCNKYQRDGRSRPPANPMKFEDPNVKVDREWGAEGYKIRTSSCYEQKYPGLFD